MTALICWSRASTAACRSVRIASCSSTSARARAVAAAEDRSTRAISWCAASRWSVRAKRPSSKSTSRSSRSVEVRSELRPLLLAGTRRRAAGELATMSGPQSSLPSGSRKDRHIGGQDGPGVAQRLPDQCEIVPPGPDSGTSEALDVGRLAEGPSDVDQVDRAVPQRGTPAHRRCRRARLSEAPGHTPLSAMRAPRADPDSPDLYHENRRWLVDGSRAGGRAASGSA